MLSGGEGVSHCHNEQAIDWVQRDQGWDCPQKHFHQKPLENHEGEQERRESHTTA
jgi:hypothetical protein